MIQEVLFFMVQYDVEAFMAACERKGLAEKTMGSYEQTLRLFGQFLSVREIERTEEVMMEGDWPLTLFTCTMDGCSRITVRFGRVQ